MSATTTTVKAPLTLAQLKEIMAGGRTTTYKPTIISFVKGTDTYLDVMEISPFSEKKIDSVFNSFNNNLKSLKLDNPNWPHIEVKKVDESVYLINVTALQGTSDED